jgi:hypothetical protein
LFIFHIVIFVNTLSTHLPFIFRSQFQFSEVDKEKAELIADLPPPRIIKQICSFVGHSSFNCRFIKDLRKISKPLCNLLAKDATFIFDAACLDAFEKL